MNLISNLNLHQHPQLTPSPMTHLPKTPKPDSKETLKLQVLQDFGHLPNEIQVKLASKFASDAVMVSDKVKEYLQKSSRSYVGLYLDIIQELPLKNLFDAINVLLPTTHTPLWVEKMVKVLGETRTLLILEVMMYLHNAHKSAQSFVNERLTTQDLIVLENLPDSAQLKELTDEVNAQLVCVATILEKHFPARLQELEKSFRVLNQEFTQAKLNWAKNQERETKAHTRGKEKAREEAIAEVAKEHQIALANLNAELQKAKTKNINLEAELQEARQRLGQIEQGGGATPERLAQLKAQYQDEAQAEMQQQLSAELRPWLAKLKEMEDLQAQFKKFETLSLEALKLAEAEAKQNDLLLQWETDRAKALPLMEKRLEQLDELMNQLLTPSETLIQLHRQLRSMVLACRQKVRIDEPLGGIVKAMMSAVRSVPEADISRVINAVQSLRDTGVLAKEEANAFIKNIKIEQWAKLDRHQRHHSPLAKLENDYFRDKAIDLFIDGYNFMHSLPEHFDKYKTDAKDKHDNPIFSAEAHQHLAELVKIIPENSEHCRVLIFLDGRFEESKKPFPGVRFITPTQQKSGKGQADEEILHYVKDHQRADANTIIVSRDKAVQRLGNHLVPKDFLLFLSSIG